MLLELDQLGFDHLNFFLFLLVFNAEIVFLGRCHARVTVEQVHIVGVPAENPLVVHNIQGLPFFFLILVELRRLVGSGVLELLLASDHLWLGTFEMLSHLRL